MTEPASWRHRAESFFGELQNRISFAVEAIDGSGFREDSWTREGGGGGRTRILENGKVFDTHDATFYTRFKKWCDEYFTLKHRGEMRGIGGVFFDYLEGDLEKTFLFVQDIGNAFLDAYLPIVKRRMNEPYGDHERQYQL